MRTYNYTFQVTCAGQGNVNKANVERMIDLAMQELCYDDDFVAALDEKTSVTIRVQEKTD